MSLLERLHQGRVFPRRVRVLAGHLAPLIPRQARVLDLGAGDGSLAKALLERHADLEIRGLDVAVRPRTAIPVERFDGLAIPFSDRTFEAVLLVDVLHHAEDPFRLLSEALRVARCVLLVKDHLREGFLATATLTLMDFVGNARHGVPTTGRYWNRRQWQDAFDRLGLQPEVWIDHLGLYAGPAHWIFERSLHFLACLRRASAPEPRCR